MNLILPGSPSFSDCTDNMTGTPPGSLVGTTFTAGANNADGSVASVLSALAHDVHYLVIGLGRISTSTANTRALADIMVDPAGGTSWTNWIDDLVCGFTAAPAAGNTACSLFYHFPIYLKAGHSLGIRARTAHSSSIGTGLINVWAFGGPQRPDMWWCGSRVESLGINAGSSSGTNVTPGSSGTFGSWTNIGTSTQRYGALQFAMNGSDTSATALGYFWQIGASSSQLRGSPTVFYSMGTNETAGRVGPCMPIWCDIPGGTTLQARATASSTGPENIDAAIYGVV